MSKMKDFHIAPYQSVKLLRDGEHNIAFAMGVLTSPSSLNPAHVPTEQSSQTPPFMYAYAIHIFQHANIYNPKQPSITALA